jgi:uncharacterized protein
MKLIRVAILFTAVTLMGSTAIAAEITFRDIESLIKQKSKSALQTALIANPKLATTRSEKGLTPLMLAAYLEQQEMVQLIRTHKPNLDFHEACIVGDMVTIRQVLARGQDVNQFSPDGFTPLGLAVFFRQEAAARLLIDAGADLNKKANNTTQVAPIHAAVARADLKTLQMLLLRGADPNLPQQRMMRPLHEASAAGSVPAAAMLLMFGADISTKNEEGKTARDFAREAGHAELAKQLERLTK